MGVRGDSDGHGGGGVGVGEAAGGPGGAAVGIGGRQWVNTGILTSQPISSLLCPCLFY